MMITTWQRLDSGARRLLPFSTALLCSLLGTMAWPVPYIGAVAPPLALMAVYYWTVHRPDLFGPLSALLIGLLHDIINGLPPGLSALVFLGVQQVLLRQQRYISGHSFVMLWAGFVVCDMLVLASTVVLLGIFRQQATPLLPVMMQFIMGVVFFPLPCWLMIRLQRTALPQG